jgi:quercetin dioxygenase-like cupin family protein
MAVHSFGHSNIAGCTLD